MRTSDRTTARITIRTPLVARSKKLMERTMGLLSVCMQAASHSVGTSAATITTIKEVMVVAVAMAGEADTVAVVGMAGGTEGEEVRDFTGVSSLSTVEAPAR